MTVMRFQIGRSDGAWNVLRNPGNWKRVPFILSIKSTMLPHFPVLRTILSLA